MKEIEQSPIETAETEKKITNPVLSEIKELMQECKNYQRFPSELINDDQGKHDPKHYPILKARFKNNPEEMKGVLEAIYEFDDFEDLLANYRKNKKLRTFIDFS